MGDLNIPLWFHQSHIIDWIEFSWLMLWVRIDGKKHFVWNSGPDLEKSLVEGMKIHSGAHLNGLHVDHVSLNIVPVGIDPTSEW